MQRKKFRWHYVYYMLAAFDIVTIAASLLLSHQITNIFNKSVEINTVWAGRASSMTELNQLVTRANAPGNDVFENGDVERERARFDMTFSQFKSTFGLARREIIDNVSENKNLFLDKLDSTNVSVEQLAVEARSVFVSIENGKPQEAGGHMATMDRHYAVASLLLGDLSNLILDQQKALFSDQLKSAAFYRQFELVFAIVIGLIIVVVTLYGHVIAKKFQELDDERESTATELEFQKFAVDEHSIVSITDEKGVITYANDKFSEICGFSQEELLGQNHRIVKSDEHSREFYVDLWKHLANGKTWHGEIKNHKKGGGSYWVDATIVPFINEDGEPFQYVAIGTDITRQKDYIKSIAQAHNELEFRVEERTSELRQEIVERKNAEKKLRNAEKMQALGSLAGGIAHNFNNALVPIRALSELVIREFPKESPNHKRLSKITEGAKRAQDLVAQIMSFSRQDEGKLKNIDPCELLQGSLLLVHSIAPATVKIIERIDKDVEEVLVDNAQIESVIFNLVSNAFDAMEGKQGKLEISLSQIELEKNDIGSDADLEEGRYAKFQFIDTGVGMDEKCMNQIFDPFFTTKEVGSGTGLGLSSAYGIVSNHGGNIKVSSELGVGTTFEVYLPLVATEVEQEVSEKGD